MSRPKHLKELIAEQLKLSSKTVVELSTTLCLPIKATQTKLALMVREGEVTFDKVTKNYVYNTGYESIRQRQIRLAAEKAAKVAERAKLKPVQGTYRPDLNTTYQPPKESHRRV